MKYNVSNMQIDYNTLKQIPNDANSYYYSVTYDIDYNGLDLKDVGLGRIFCLEKSNDSYIVTAFGATSI